jgi:hypothetical protein
MNDIGTALILCLVVLAIFAMLMPVFVFLIWRQLGQILVLLIRSQPPMGDVVDRLEDPHRVGEVARILRDLKRAEASAEKAADATDGVQRYDH